MGSRLRGRVRRLEPTMWRTRWELKQRAEDATQRGYDVTCKLTQECVGYLGTHSVDLTDFPRPLGGLGLSEENLGGTTSIVRAGPSPPATRS